MMRRRDFVAVATGLTSALTRRPAFGKSTLEAKERVDRALKGDDVDRPPFSFWHHFGLHTPEAHASATLKFHQQFRTDFVKVMSDFPYPKGTGTAWYNLKLVANPFPQQIRALELVRQGLNGRAYFIETVFNSWNVAEKLSSPQEVRRLQRENPQALMDALDIITQSQIHHIRRALGSGASGILLSIANANAREMSVDDYTKFSAPFDKRLMAAAGGAKLSFLHLHVEEPYLSRFHAFEAPVINYSDQVSGIPIRDVRQQFSQVIAGGIDEVNYKKLSREDLRKQMESARLQAGPRFILTPGCSVPNDTTDEELRRLPAVLNA
jgi:uroporphyrinogen decarboxylase